MGWSLQLKFGLRVFRSTLEDEMGFWPVTLTCDYVGFPHLADSGGDFIDDGR